MLERMSRLGSRAWREHGHLIAGSSAFTGAMAIQATGGILYWLIAARTTDADVVGVGSALASSTVFVIYATGLGINLSLSRFAQGDGLGDRQQLGVGALVSVLTSLLGAALFLLVVRGEHTQGAFSAERGPLTFCLLTAALSLPSIVDTHLLVTRRRRWLLGRSAFCGVARLTLLVLVVPSARLTGYWLYVFLVLPDAVTGVIGLVAIVRGALLRAIVGDWQATGTVPAVRYAARNFGTQTAMQLPIFLVPVIVLLNVPPDVNASFYIAWSATTMVMFIPQAMMWTLHGEAGRDGSDITRQVRFSLRVTVVATLACTAAATVCAPLVTVVYGQEFSDAARMLPLLVAGAVPWSVSVIRLTEAWLLVRTGTAWALTVVSVASCVVPSLVLTDRYGAAGAIAAWLGGATVGAVVATLLVGALERRSLAPARR